MDQTWYEIVRSMASLGNDIKKNSKTKSVRQMANASNSQQQLKTSTTTNEAAVTPVDNVETNVIM
jgi:hypothetical protein